jgi:hypothetical protein
MDFEGAMVKVLFHDRREPCAIVDEFPQWVLLTFSAATHTRCPAISLEIGWGVGCEINKRTPPAVEKQNPS